MAMPLEGLIRNDSIHAAAVVICDEPLTEYVPLQQKGDAEVVTQFEHERRRPSSACSRWTSSACATSTSSRRRSTIIEQTRGV